MVAQPLLIKAGIDSLTTGFSMRTLLWFCGGLVGLSVLKGVFQYYMRIILVGISRDVEFDIHNDLWAHLLTLYGDFFTRYRTGDILSRSTSNLNAVRMMLGPGVMYWFETVLTFASGGVRDDGVDWRLTLIALSPAPLVSIAVIYSEESTSGSRRFRRSLRASAAGCKRIWRVCAWYALIRRNGRKWRCSIS